MELDHCNGPRAAVDFAEFRPLLEELFEQIKQSVRQHGDWREYDEGLVFEAVTGEWDEYREALLAGDMFGEHGQIAELMDTAVTALKGVLQLRKLHGTPGGS